MNWRQIYGDDAFIIKPPLYWSDYQRILERKKINIEELEMQAVEYAKMQCEILTLSYEDVISGKCTVPEEVIKEPEIKPKAHQETKKSNQEGNAINNGITNEKIRFGDINTNIIIQDEKPEDTLPKGWSTAKDSEGRTYYWHRETKQTQWEMPK